MSRVLDQAFEQSLKAEEQAIAPMAGGIMQHGYQCGMIWGASLAAGAQAYRLFGPGPQAEAMTIHAAQKIVSSFQKLNKYINCLEITDMDKSSSAMEMIKFFLLKGGTIGCFRMAARSAPVAFDDINAAFSDNNIETPSPPVSCSTLLARKMGESDLHAVMAAGFAGGIGLCGGACGALGTAIWIYAMKSSEQQRARVKFRDPGSQGIIDRFISHTDYKFECSKIVGRKFDGIKDHADYLREEGCDDLIEVLANG